MSKYRKTNSISLSILFVAFLSVSCSFSVTPVYNNNKEVKSENVKDVQNRDDLKVKAIDAVNLLHKLLEERKFEEAYQMIDDNSSLKLPKSEAIKNLQEIVDTLGKMEKMNLTRDNVVEERGQIQVRQEFIVKFDKDTPSPNRYEIFIWNVYSDNNFKLWTYINSKGEE